MPSSPPWAARPVGNGLWLTCVIRQTVPSSAHTGFRSHSPSYNRRYPNGPSRTSCGPGSPARARSTARKAALDAKPICRARAGPPSMCDCMVPEFCAYARPRAFLSRTSSRPASLLTAAVAPKTPAVAGRKNRSPVFAAMPMDAATSTPSASASMSSRPDTPPDRSMNASAAD